MESIFQKDDLAKALHDNQFVVAHFYTGWCEPSMELNALMDEWVRQKKFEKVTFIAIDAEKATDIVHDLSVHAVPMIVFFRKTKFVFNIEGAHVEQIKSTINRIYYAADAEESLETRLENIINQQRIMVFLTGTPTEPQCGFTSRICKILRDANINYGFFDIMSDEEVLHGLKKYSNWPTYPQVYVDGDLVGGCDMVVDAAEAGTLGELFLSSKP